jgi:hypothetical protein
MSDPVHLTPLQSQRRIPICTHAYIASAKSRNMHTLVPKPQERSRTKPNNPWYALSAMGQPGSSPISTATLQSNIHMS